MWFLLNKNALWKMDSKGFATEKVRALPSAAHFETANLVPHNLVVDFDAKDPAMAPDAPEPSPVKPPGTSTPTKPISKYIASPHQSARGGDAGIKRIILHYTTAGTMSSTVNWFLDPTSRVSAHYIVGKDGEIVQMVRDAAKAWHAGNENNDSIGIEHVARKGERLTTAQSNASANLIHWLKSEYKLTNANVTAHRFTHAGKGTGTDCPGDLWKTEADLKAWLAEECPDAVAPAPKPPVDASVATLRHVGSHNGTWSGLLQLDLRIGDEGFSVASGARGAQTLRRPQDPRSTPGNLEPIPQGRYKIGSIEFASGKDNYEGTWGNGLGPVWVGLDAEFSDDRGAFGFHIDQNIGASTGSAGCVVFRDVPDLKRFVAALRKHNPSVLSVEYSL